MIRVITEAISRFVQNILNRIDEWRRRSEFICEEERYRTELEQSDKAYHPERVDVILGLKCREYLAAIFPDGIEAKVRNMSNEELLALFRRIEKDAERIMEVQIDVVDFYTAADMPYCNYGGYYMDMDNSFHINMVPVYSGDSSCIEYQIYAIFHELKHARQWTAVKGRIDGSRDYGYSDELLNEWARNMTVYIPLEESDELYRKQPLEMDSFGFSSIVSGERQFEVI